MMEERKIVISETEERLTERILKMCKTHEFSEDETMALTTMVLAAFHLGTLSMPTSDKEAYWLGVMRGIERHSWVMNGVRYVGVGAVTLSAALLEVKEEKEEAMKL